MTILVTGATGHLGANLVRRLLADGEKVRVLLERGSSTRAIAGLEVETAEGDVRDPASVREAVRGCSRVYHTAARVSTTHGNEREIYDTNVIGTRNVLAAAQDAAVKRVVVTSSFSAVGHSDGRASHERDAFDPFQPHMPYEISKAWMEHECLKAVVGGLDVVIAISCAILGPNDFEPSRMGRVIRDFGNGKLRAYIPGGFEFVAVDDLVEGHLLAMEHGRTGHRYIFSTEYVSVDQLVTMLERITGRSKPGLRLPPAVMSAMAHVSDIVMPRLFPQAPRRFTAGAVRLLQMQRRADISKACSELGYHPTSVERAIEQAYQWFLAQGEIAGATRAPAPVVTAPTQHERVAKSQPSQVVA